MLQPLQPAHAPAPANRLLVSVRESTEAISAMEGGADVIDVKEPTRGPLGSPDAATVRGVIEAVDGTRPVTVAGGELDETALARVGRLAAAPGVAAVKLGLGAGTGGRWCDRAAAIAASLPGGVDLVLTAYVDRPRGAPTVREILDASRSLGLRWMLLDTADKRRGGLFDHAGASEIGETVALAHDAGVSVCLAGRLSAETLREAAACRPALIGVRGAACRGGRDGVVDPRLVTEAVAAIQLAPA